MTIFEIRCDRWGWVPGRLTTFMLGFRWRGGPWRVRTIKLPLPTPKKRSC